MDDEPDIVKMLRDEEKLGVLHCSIQKLISHNDKVDDTSEEIEAESVKFTDNDLELASTIHIKTLFLGISGQDYDQILLQLKKSGYNVDVKSVSSEKEFEENLQNNNWDIILADYTLSKISLSKIVTIVKNTKPETPIILVADKIKEDEAISFLEKGVSNYVLKENLKRTGVVVKQTLELIYLKKTKDSEDTYQDLFENANDLIQAVRPDGSFLYVNSAWKKTLGYSDKEISNLNVFDVMSKESIPHCKEVFKKIMSGEKVNDIETIFLTKKGKKICLQGSISCNFKDGKPFSTRGIFRDITKRKTLEKTLEMYKNSLDNATDAIGISSAQGKHFYQNKAFEQMFGKIGENPVEAVYFDKKVGEEVFRTIMSGKPWTGELKMHTRNGLVRDIYLNAYPNIDDDGNITSLVGIHTDITEQKQAEETLRENEEKLRSIVETTNDWIWEVDKKGIYTYVSPKVTDLLGYRPEEVIGKTPFDLMPKDEVERVASTFLECIKSNKPIIRLENTNLHKDGRRVVLETNGAPFFDSSGNLLGYRGIDRDITERKQSEEKYKSLFESSKDAIMILEPPSWNFTQVNKATLEMFGVKDKKEMKKLGPWDVSPKNQPDGEASDTKAKKMIQKAMTQGSNYFEWMHKRLNGQDFSSTVLLTRIDLEGKNFLQATVRDVSKEKTIQKKFEIIFNSSVDAVFLHELPSLKIVEVNDEVCRRFGYTKEEIKKVTVNDLSEGKYFSDDSKESQEFFKKLMNGETIVTEWLSKTKKGELIWHELHAKSVDLLGEKLLLVIAHDITDRKKIDEKIKFLLDAAGDGIRIVGKDYKITSLNKTMAELAGVKQENAIGLTCKDIFRSDFCETSECSLKTVLKNGEGYQKEQNMTRADGKIVPCLLKVTPYKDENGQIIGIIEDYCDISHIKETQEKLKKSYGIINKSPVVAFTWKNEENWPVDYVSDNVKDLFGYSTKEFIDGKIQFSKTIHPDDLKRVESEVKKYSEDKKCNEFTQDYRIITKKGEVKWIYDRTMIRRDDKVNPIFFDGIILDITEDKRKENELKEKIEELERYKKVTVGREIKMIELKEKIKKLEGDKK